MRGYRLQQSKHRAARVFKYYNGFNPRNEKQGNHFWSRRMSDDEISRVLGIYRKTKVPCSCCGCGNPRRHWKYLPMQEIRMHLEADDQYSELVWCHRKSRWRYKLD